MDLPINAELKLNTQEASQSIQDLNKSMVLPPSGGPQVLGAGGPLNQLSPLSPQSFQTYNNLNFVLKNFTDQMSKVIEKFKVFEKTLEESNTNGNSGANNNPSSNSFFNKFFTSNGKEGFINAPSMIGASTAFMTSLASGAESYTQAQARGDYMGARSSFWNSVGSGMTGAGSIMALIPGLRVAGAVVGGLGAIAKIAGAKSETEAMYHGFAKEDSDFIQGLGNYWGEGTERKTSLLDKNPSARTIYNYDNGKNYGGSASIYGQSFDKNGNNITGQVNTERLFSLEQKILKENIDYGMEDSEFKNLVLNQRKYGVTDIDQAVSNAKTVGFYHNTTGVDSSQLDSVIGTITRYGKGSGNDIDRIYQASTYSGLDKSQFGEFLNGIQMAMQEGVQKGFVRSAESISDSLVTVSAIGANSSNPELWKGENGARLASSFSNAMGQATNLADTGSMIMYQAMKNLNPTMDYWDIMKELEIGNFNDKYYNELTKLNEYYTNGDKGSLIELLRKELGVNYTQAIDIANGGEIDINSNDINSTPLPQNVRTIQTNEVNLQNSKRREGELKGFESYTTDMKNNGAPITDSTIYGPRADKFQGPTDGKTYFNSFGMAKMDEMAYYANKHGNPELKTKWDNAVGNADRESIIVTKDLIDKMSELITAFNNFSDIEVDLSIQDVIRQR